jgi:hypothetical protein
MNYKFSIGLVEDRRYVVIEVAPPYEFLGSMSISRWTTAKLDIYISGIKSVLQHEVNEYERSQTK